MLMKKLKDMENKLKNNQIKKLNFTFNNQANINNK